jgi:1,4-alpha-glucan branching enzyme
MSAANPFFLELDQHLFNAGRHYRIWEKLGAHPTELLGQRGTHFAVWAPTAAGVAVIGEWNDWNPEANPLIRVQGSGVWEAFVAGVGEGALYKYVLWSLRRGGRGPAADRVQGLRPRPLHLGR